MQIGHSIWARASAEMAARFAAEKLGQASTNKLSSGGALRPAWNCYTVLRLSGLLIRRSWVRVPPGSVGFHMRRSRSQAGDRFCPHHCEHDFVDKTLLLGCLKTWREAGIAERFLAPG